MIRKSSCSGSSRQRRVGLLLRGAVLLLVAGAGPTGKAASLPDWLAAAKQVDIGQFGAGSAAVVVGQWTDFSVDATGKFLWTERCALRVLDLRAAERYLRVIGYENTDESVVSIQAWSVSPSGRVLQSDKKNVATASAYPSFILYSDDRTKIVSIPGTETGSLVGYELIRTGHLPLSGVRFGLEEEIPVRLAELHVSVPSGAIRWFVKHPERVEVVNQSANAATFRIANRPGLPPESSAPPFDSLAAAVFVNYDARGVAPVESWEDAGRAIHPLLSGAEKPAPEITAQVDSLTAGQADLPAKLNAAYTFVSRQIRYVAVEIGIGGFEPHAAADVFQNRYGDCKDKATLLLTMLDHLGLHGYPALVGTRGDVEADPKIPTLATFDHMIVALPVTPELQAAVQGFSSYDTESKILWMDPTSDADPLGRLPEMDQGVFALISYPDHGDLRLIPELRAEQNGVEYKAELQLGPEGSGTASVEERYFGSDDASRHSFYRNLSQDQIRVKFEERTSRYANQSVFRQGSVSGMNDNATPIVEKFSFVGKFADALSGDGWFFQPLFLAGIAVPEISPRPRVLPLELGIPYHLRAQYRVELPVGMTVAELPQPASVKSEFGTLEVSYSVDGTAVAAEEELLLVASRIPPEKYEAFRQFVNAVRRAEQVRLRTIRMP
jgi:Domain of Unknown Function with PDB structure (DUF3857)